MEELAEVQVPYYLSIEQQALRQKQFDAEVNAICLKYLDLGYTFKRGFNFKEGTILGHGQRILFEFPQELNIPMEMQKELAKSWCKLFYP